MTAPAALLAGQVNPVEISLINRGFSTLFNEHPVYLVLIDESGKVCHVVLTDANVNDWQPYEPGDSTCTPLLHTISADLQIPAGLAKGTYRLGLWIPDGSARLTIVLRSVVQTAIRSGGCRLTESMVSIS